MRMWATSVIGSEGLLLSLVPNTSNMYERLGVFYVEELTAFYPPEAAIKDTGERGRFVDRKSPKLIKENMPMQRVVLI